jgi:hypothetical protein
MSTPALASKVYECADIDEFTELAYQKGWTDGLPVLPPTEKKVGAMLDYIRRDPQEVLGVISPGEGVATIEKIAINAVMAGCLPEYLPVVITAVEAMLDPVFELMRVQCTTGGPGPLVIVSGPVVKKLDFNFGEGAFTGTGHRANSTIGRAVRLILWNIGLGRPGQMSHATMGHPGRYAYLVAERPPEEANPWEPIHVTNGLKAEDSAVSMYPSGAHTQFNMGAGANTIDNNLFVCKDVLTNLGQFQAAMQKLLVINPQAASVLHGAGWDKTKFRDELLKRSVRPVRDLKRTGGQSTTATWHWTKIVDVNNDDALVPSMIDAHHLQIMVAGGWAPPISQCCCINSMHGEMVTKKINWSWD